MVTAAVAAGKSTIDAGYEIAEIAKQAVLDKVKEIKLHQTEYEFRIEIFLEINA